MCVQLHCGAVVLLALIISTASALEIHITCSTTSPCPDLDQALIDNTANTDLTIYVDDANTYTFCSSIDSYSSLQVISTAAAVECTTGTIQVPTGTDLTLQGLNLGNFSNNVVNLVSGSLSILDCSSTSQYQGLVTSTTSSSGLISISNSSFTSVSYSTRLISAQGSLSVNISTSTFLNCGEVVFSTAESVTILQSIFTDNAEALYCNETASVSIHDSTFDGNGISDHGIRLYSVSSLTATGSSFINHANGAIFLSECTASIMHSIFDRNSGNYGGSIEAENTDLNVQFCNFSNDYASVDGGSIEVVYGDFIGSDNVFRDCSSGDDAGALHLAQTSSASISRCKFINNLCDDRGGAIYFNMANSGSYVSMDNCTFIGNQAGGGGAVFKRSGSASFTNCYFDNNYASKQGGACLTYYSSGLLEIENSSFIRNSAESGGGACRGSSSGAILVRNSYFESNYASNAGGGAFQMVSTALTVEDSEFILNQEIGSTGGGAIYGIDADISIYRSSFRNNSATYSGGAIRVEENTLSVENSTFLSNQAGNNGGSIEAENTDLNVQFCNFSNDYASVDGGSIDLEYGDFIASDNVFRNSSSGDNAGALNVKYTSSGTVSRCKFINNLCDDRGGAIYFNMANSGSYVSMDNCAFIGNQGGDGGAVFKLSGSASCTNCYFENNYASNQGGACHTFYSSGLLEIENSSFIRNSAENGGGVCRGSSSSAILVRNSYFESNYASDGGGGAFQMVSTDLTVEDSEFILNQEIGSTGGGAIYGINADIIIYRSSFRNNSATYSGGAIRVEESTLSVENSTFMSNQAGSDGGSITSNSAAIDLEGCNFMGGSAPGSGGAALFESCTGTIRNCNFSDLCAENGAALGFHQSIMSSTSNIFSLTTATMNGGSLWASDASKLDITDSVFTETSASSGGAIRVESASEISLSSSTFERTHASYRGGAIDSEGASEISITTSTFSHNNGSLYGGSIFLDLTSSHLSVGESVFSENSASYGGAIYSEATVSLELSSLTSNIATISGGGIFLSSATLTSSDSVFSSNYAGSFGGGIYLSGSNAQLFQLIFSSNNATSGGAFSIVDGTASMTSCETNDNFALEYGGAINAQNDSTVVVTVHQTNGNYADFGGFVRSQNSSLSIASSSSTSETAQNGGILFIQDSNFDIQGSTFSNSFASKNGGFLYHEGTGISRIDNSNFQECEAIDYGGAIYMASNEATSLHIEKSDFENNAASSGSAIYSEPGIHISMKNLNMRLHSQALNGTVIYGRMINLTVDACEFSDNTGSSVHLITSDIDLNEVSFLGNTGRDSSGLYTYDSVVLISNGVFSDNTCTDGFCSSLVLQNSTGIISASTFSANMGMSGAAVSIWNGSDINITECTFSRNSAAYGAGIYVNDATLMISQGLFDQNSATKNAGAIQGVSANLMITQTQFTTNVAGENGGAIADEKCIINVTDSTFQQNSAEYGGSIYIDQSQYAVLEDVIMSSNTATFGACIALNNSYTFEMLSSVYTNNEAVHGGVAYSESSEAEWNSSFFQSNRASDDGGVMMLDKQSKLRLNNCDFDSNTAQSDGGVVFMQNGTSLTMNAVSASNNIGTSGDGGMIFSSNSLLKITESTFSRNSAGSSGGFLFAVESEVNLSGVVWLHNQADNGACTASVDSDVSLRSSTVQSNSASNGGVILMTRGTLEVDSTNFTGNSAEMGGVILMTRGSLEVDSTNFTGNSAEMGGVCYIDSGNSTFLDTLFASNVAMNGGAIYASNAASLNTSSSLFVNNLATTSGGAIYSTDVILNVQQSEFVRNRADDGKDLSQISCFGSGAGGAIFMEVLVCDSNFIDSVFTNNTASSVAAVLAVASDPSICFNDTLLIDSELQNNQAPIVDEIYLIDSDFDFLIDFPDNLTLGSKQITGIQVLSHKGVVSLPLETSISITFADADIYVHEAALVGGDTITYKVFSTISEPETFSRTQMSITVTGFEHCGFIVSATFDVNVFHGFCPIYQGIVDVLLINQRELYTCELCAAGKFSNSSTDQFCNNCPIGQYSNESGASVCFKCDPGSYTPLDSTACTPCSPGSYADSAASECKICPAGTYSEEEGNSVCTECLPGQFSAEAALKCTECESGFFTPENGSLRCEACPLGKFSVYPGSSTCESCPDNATTLDSGSMSIRDCVCKENLHGYAYEGEMCHECPTVGFICPLNSSVPYVLAGYFRKEGSQGAHECVPKKACLSGGYAGTICDTGYDGPLCSVCASSYYRSAIDCLECGSNLVRYTLLCVVCTFLSYVAYRLHHKNKITRDIRIVVNSFQVMSLYPSASSAWPSSMLSLFRISSIAFLNVDLLSVECSMSISYWTKWRMRLISPLLGFSLVYVSARIYHIVARTQHSNGLRMSFKERLPAITNACIFIMLIMFAMIVSSIFEPFNCSKQPDGSEAMMFNSAVDCFDEEWMSHFPELLIAFFAYIVIFPCWVAYTLFSYRHNLESEAFRKFYGVLTVTYAPHAYYWELVDIVFKTCIVMTRDFGSYLSSEYGVIFIIIAILLSHLSAQSFVQPFKEISKNRLAFLWDVVSLTILLSVIAFISEDTNETEILVYSILIISLVVIALLITFRRWYHKIKKIFVQRRNKKTELVGPRIQFQQSQLSRQEQIE